ncbi:MAG: hypothetical protein JNM93_02650 [Bacteriovoracaceae bacterium]|nr:hypothetical protein [Bacteriovoracaceae bacterium]
MKFFISSLIIFLTSCGTYRTFNDKELENLTGERNMTSVLNCWDVPACYKKSIEAAKQECLSENKKFQLIRNNAQIVTYKCN